MNQPIMGYIYKPTTWDRVFYPPTFGNAVVIISQSTTPSPAPYDPTKLK